MAKLSFYALDIKYVTRNADRWTDGFDRLTVDPIHNKILFFWQGDLKKEIHVQTYKMCQ